jgi:hypothetical protein
MVLLHAAGISTEFELLGLHISILLQNFHTEIFRIKTKAECEIEFFQEYLFFVITFFITFDNKVTSVYLCCKCKSFHTADTFMYCILFIRLLPALSVCC